MHARLIVLVGLGLSAAILLGGCALHGGAPNDSSPQEFSGHYTGGPSGSWFRPCGAAPKNPSWWVTFTGRSVAQADEARRAGRLEPGKRYFVRLSATETLDGQVGPQGKGVPALLVRELLEVREEAEGDCPADPSGPPPSS